MKPVYSWLKWLAPALSLAMLVLAFVVLHRGLEGYHLRDVLQAVRAVPFELLAWAVCWTIASYVVLGGYDWLALRYTQQPVKPWRAWVTSFVAFAVGHNVGFATLSGGAIRLRMYGAVGVPAAQVALMSAFCAFTTMLGLSALLALALLTDSAAATRMLHWPISSVLVAGVLLLSLLLSYLWWLHRRRLTTQSAQWRDWSIPLPTVPMTLAQMAVAAVDLCLAAAALYVLLPNSVPFVQFLLAYVLATAAVLLANVPGGLGVLEAVMLLALPQVPVATLLAALLVYRVLYYVVPLAIATVCLVAHELWLQWFRKLPATALTSRRWHVGQWYWVRKVAGVARSWLSAVLPQVLSVVVALAGMVLLLSGVTPGVSNRLLVLSEWLPLPVLELSHLAGSVVGLGLLILSRGLFRRVQLAWQWTLLLLLAGALFSLLKGWDYEEALLMLGVALLLYGAQASFYRHAALSERSFSPRWLVGFVMVIGVIIWVGLLAYRHVDYSNQLWWTFAWEGDAPRMLRASLLVCVLLAGWVLYVALSPTAPAASSLSLEDRQSAEPIVSAATRATANLVFTHDKRLLFHEQRDALLMYQVAGRSWVAMGDPVVTHSAPQVARERAAELAWSFREMSDQHDGWTVFYQVTPECLPIYLDLGLALLKLGEEARVHLPEFSLAGSHRAEFRTARRKAEREGVSFEILQPPLAPAVLAELADISQQWLSAKAAHEKQFSVGFFATDYLQHFPIAVARVNGRMVAFANLWTTQLRYELSVDLMRYGSDAPKGVMDYLFVEIMLWGKSQGYQWFSLGMAPLSGLEQHPLAPAWHRFGNWLFDVGGQFYNFEGLRRYKDKYQPVWEPRYLAAPGGLALPRVLLDVTSLIAGGMREIFIK